MTDKLINFELPRISRDPLDTLQPGDWFWVKFDDTEYDPKKEKHVKVGEHETLMCVEEVGSNYVGFTTRSGRNHSYTDVRIHFNKFISRCREEPNWKQVLQDKMNTLQLQIAEKTREMVDQGKRLYLIPDKSAPAPDPNQSMLPMKVADEPKRYKRELVKFQKKSLPAISKEIEELAEEFGVTATQLSLPDLVRLGVVKSKLGVVEDRIFTIELYCGLQEEVKQIADGEPAPAETKITVRQQMLYMDEETLFDYETGGMDFDSIKKFDKWVCKSETLNRVLPEQKGIVAFRVRRSEKDYGPCFSISQALMQISWHQANEQTYLLIRNGQRVYRIASEIDFSPRLIPKRDEIGEEQFKKRIENWEFDDDYGKNLSHGAKRVVTEELITPESVEFDDHVKKVDALLKHYNRIIILLQGLLDRSKVFHPHPPVNLCHTGEIDEWVNLVRDEEMGLPCNKIDWKTYQQQLNSTLKVGKYIVIQFPPIHYSDRRSYRYDDELHKEVVRPKRAYGYAEMPRFCKVDAIKRDKSAVRVSWPQEKRANPIEGKWIPSKDKPGWGHREWIYETDRMLHEWIPIKYVFNVSDYTPNDYRMFLCDRALQGQYLRWASFLLGAEDWLTEQRKEEKE